MKIDGRQAKVCIDPGHGGHDSGAVGPTGLKESDVVLSVCKELMFQLEELGVDSYLTRTEDEYISLSKRTEESEDSDCMISVHCNAHDSQAHGIETIYPKAAGLSKALANYVQQSLMKYCKGHRDRQIKMSPSPRYPRNLSLMANAVVPTCLTELEFISNIEQEKWLSDDESHRQIAHAIAQGIKSFLLTLPGAVRSEDRESRAIRSEDRGDERRLGSPAISVVAKEAASNAETTPLEEEIADPLDILTDTEEDKSVLEEMLEKSKPEPNAWYPEDEPEDFEAVNISDAPLMTEVKPKKKKRSWGGLKRKTKRKSKS